MFCIYRILKIKEHPELIDQASLWFSTKFNVSQEAYKQSMLESIHNESIPNWFVYVKDNQIVGGCGVIEYDFHDEKEITPNLCALYIDQQHRKKGLAKNLLDRVSKQYDTLYLITDHTDFYEKCGWTFHSIIQTDSDEHLSRVYKKSRG